MDQAWFVPTVIIAVAGIALQGLKAGWDLVFSIRTQMNSGRALRLQELASLMNLVESLPLDAARKAASKVELIVLFQQGKPSPEMYAKLNEIIAQATGW